jgi:hypothetical protein
VGRFEVETYLNAFMLSFWKWISPFCNLRQLPQTSHQLRLVKTFAWFGFVTNIPLSTLFHLTLCYFSEGRMYTSDLFSTCAECSAKFVKSVRITPFSIQAVQIFNTRKRRPLFKFDITYRSPSTVSRKSFFLPGIVEFLQRSSLPPQLQKFRLCFKLLSCTAILQPN